MLSTTLPFSSYFKVGIHFNIQSIQQIRITNIDIIMCIQSVIKVQKLIVSLLVVHKFFGYKFFGYKHLITI